MINKIFNEDCLVGMNRIPNESVDLLLTDPPYNVSMKSNFSSMGRTGVDFGEWDKGFNQEEWLKTACSKVKKSGSVVVFNDYKNIGTMTGVLESNGFTVKELILWKKPNPMPRNRDRLYVTTIEVALWAVKGKGWVFNRQKETYENAIFEAPTVSHKHRIHTTQKPASIIENLLKIHSNEGDTVLDCFMGSGTTAIACLNTNRNYIGFELEKEYFEKINQRIESYHSNTKEAN
ncbi:DNA-methyltransferase [Bacillus cereus]|uniref:DNA-methyltransferase n=1 Tax=Bacillus cereus TaxID=1396 RepID=UPI001C54F019|nr:site-specific DNA-methyltransferase [Bacillus cereus]